MVNNFAARSVDKIRAFTHRAKEICAEKGARLRFQGDVDAYDVRVARDIEGISAALDAEFRRRFVCEASTPRDDVHAEGARARRDLATDLARADESERATEEAARF